MFVIVALKIIKMISDLVRYVAVTLPKYLCQDAIFKNSLVVKIKFSLSSKMMGSD